MRLRLLLWCILVFLGLGFAQNIILSHKIAKLYEATIDMQKILYEGVCE